MKCDRKIDFMPCMLRDERMIRALNSHGAFTLWTRTPQSCVLFLPSGSEIEMESLLLSLSPCRVLPAL